MTISIYPKAFWFVVLLIGATWSATLQAAPKGGSSDAESYTRAYTDIAVQIAQMNERLQDLDVDNFGDEELEELALLLLEYSEMEEGAQELINYNLYEAHKKNRWESFVFEDFRRGTWLPLERKYDQIQEHYSGLVRKMEETQRDAMGGSSDTTKDERS